MVDSMAKELSNIYLTIKSSVASANNALVQSGVLPSTIDFSRFVVEPTRDPSHGDMSSNVAMVIAKEAGMPPRMLADHYVTQLRQDPFIANVEIAGPGFINFKLKNETLFGALRAVLVAGDGYGRSDLGSGEKVNVEYVSANPTGPMHVGHCRGAVFGDALASLLSFAGYDVTKEYYVNDAGSQVDVLARSAFERYKQALNLPFNISEGMYPGDYLVPIGKLLKKFYGSKLSTLPEDVWLPMVRALAISEMMKQIRKDLKALKIKQDKFFSERTLIEGRPKRLIPARTWTPELINAVESLRKKHPSFGAIKLGPLVRKEGFSATDGVVKHILAFLKACRLVRPGRNPGNPLLDQVGATIEWLRAQNDIYEGVLPPPKGGPVEDYEDREQTLFRATAFGDDVDRPLKKSDGSYTYFASDIAYHKTKFDRGFLTMVDVWGADHGGYIKRVQAAIKAVTAGKATLDVKIVQLVKLLRNGEPVKMSKRSGDFVTLREVVDEVGSDAVRFMMLFRKNDAVLDFDMAKVLEQSKDNPVFYVQYGHARGHSIFKNARETIPSLPMDGVKRIAFLKAAKIERLSDPVELSLIRQIALFPRIVEAAAVAHEPHRIAFYLYDLASEFHALWTKGRDLPHLRFIIENDAEITVARLALVQGVVSVLASGLAVLGVHAPDEMR